MNKIVIESPRDPHSVEDSYGVPLWFNYETKCFFVKTSNGWYEIPSKKVEPKCLDVGRK